MLNVARSKAAEKHLTLEWRLAIEQAHALEPVKLEVLSKIAEAMAKKHLALDQATAVKDWWAWVDRNTVGGASKAHRLTKVLVGC